MSTAMTMSEDLLLFIQEHARMSTLPGDMSTLTKRLAGPSTAKAGMDTVDQAKVNDIIYKASEVLVHPDVVC